MTDPFDVILDRVDAADWKEVDALVAALPIVQTPVLKAVTRQLRRLGKAGDTRLFPLARALCARARRTGAAPELARVLTTASKSLAGPERWTEIVALLDDVLALDPDNPRALRRQALALIELGRVAEAVERLESLLILDPTNVTAARVIAVNLNAGKIAPIAERVAPLVVERARRDPAARGDCMRVLVRLLRVDEARTFLEESSSYADPSIASAAFDIGITSNDPEMALRALRERSWDAESAAKKDAWLVRLALLQADRHALRQAHERLAAAGQLEQLDAPVWHSANLALGNYRDAFEPWDRKRRLRVAELVPQLFRLTDPLGSARGKKVLIIAYTELGDEIKLIEFVDRVRPMFGACTIVTDRRIRDLVARGRDGLIVIGKEKNIPAPADSPVPVALRRHLGDAEWARIADFDVVFLIKDLQGLLVETVDDLPQNPRLLEANSELRLMWRERLRQYGSGPRIGLYWRSGLVNYKRFAKLTTLEQWQPILDACPGATFVNFQFGAGVSEEIADVSSLATVVEMPGLNTKDDIDSVAALMCELDAVVTVPGTTMHLAGAVGARTLSVTHSSQALWRARPGSNVGTYNPNVEVITGPAEQGFDGAIANTAARLRELFGDRSQDR